MIQLACPNCGKSFPVMLVESRGHCGCGLDFDLKLAGATLHVLWTPDPNFPQSGSQTYEQSFSLAPS